MAQKRAYYAFAGNAFKDPGTRHPTVERAQAIDNDPPFERLKLKLNVLKGNNRVHNVLHWFRTKDLRIEDNKSLSQAARLIKEKASKSGGKLLTAIVVSPDEFDWHGVGAARKLFLVNNMKLLAVQLKTLGIPFVPLFAESRHDIVPKLVEFAENNDASHVYANYEYEFDELERDLRAANELEAKEIAFHLFHDQTVVEPGLVTNAKGEPRKVFTSYWNGWIPMVAKNPQKLYIDHEKAPSKQDLKGDDKSLKLLTAFDADKLDEVLGICRNDDELKNIENLWPAGHDAAVARLREFLKKKIAMYGERRSNPADDCTSRMSPYFALGIISVREALALTRKEANNDRDFGTSTSGVNSWVREIVFREFYRHMVASAIPHVVMNMPTSLRLADIDNEHDENAWKRWCEGRTGVPFVDAGMRQLNTEGYMHNRLRMNVASYLRMNLLIDFRLGLRFFASKLVDWDCCNNSFGWDPNYTVFNPVLQAEKLDPEGKYIRKWVPELRDIQGKAIFDPANRLPKHEFAKLGYTRPIIDHQEAKSRAIERFKSAGGKKIKSETE